MRRSDNKTVLRLWDGLQQRSSSHDSFLKTSLPLAAFYPVVMTSEHTKGHRCFVPGARLSTHIAAQSQESQARFLFFPLGDEWSEVDGFCFLLLHFQQTFWWSGICHSGHPLTSWPQPPRVRFQKHHSMFTDAGTQEESLCEENAQRLMEINK